MADPAISQSFALRPPGRSKQKVTKWKDPDSTQSRYRWRPRDRHGSLTMALKGLADGQGS